MLLSGPKMSETQSPPNEEPAPAAACTNCSEPLTGPYCANCGQRDSDIHRPLRELLSEWLGGIVDFDSRLAKTIPPLIARPGFLTQEFLAGRRVRYVHPLKLYLVISLVFFIGLAMAGQSFIRVGDREDAHVVTINFGESGGADTEGDTASSAPNTAEDITVGTSENASEDPSQQSIWQALWLDIAKLHEEDPGKLDQLFIDRLAKSVFILVPVFALFLKLLFRERGILYIEHLVCSLHLHSFAFLALFSGFAVNSAIGNPQGPGSPASVIVILIYSFMALRRVYSDGRFRTTLKMVALFFAYLIAILFTIVLTLFLTWFTI